MVLTEINISTAAYCQNRLGYDIVCLLDWSASSCADQGGMGLISQDRPSGWSLDSTLFQWSNMASFKVITGMSRTLIIIAFLQPSTLAYLPNLEESLAR